MKYCLLKNFLPKEILPILVDYCKIKHRNNEDSFSPTDDVADGDSYFYGDSIMEALLNIQGKKLQEKLNLKLLPTYSFWRMYTKYATLIKHKDRPACEYSITTFIGSDGSFQWPFYADDKEFILEPGDAVFYKGREVAHWRNEFLGDWHAQLFLHYVNAEGPFVKELLDKRERLGIKK